MINLKTDDLENDNYRRFSHVSKERCSPLQWEEIPNYMETTRVAYQIAAEIGNYMYIHGGIQDKNSLKPTNAFYRIDLSTFKVEYLTSDNSPFLSQHACVVLDHRYLVIIGGWDGHSRLNRVHVFDSQIMNWLKSPIVTGFPEKAGLSGHTANASIKNRGAFPDIIIIGREGSIKTQRRYGNGYKLSCNKDLSHFDYSELQINLDSRSCHCASILNNKLFIVGGRDDKVIDIHVLKKLIPDVLCTVVSDIIERLDRFDLQKCPITGRRKAARRGHSMIPGKNGFVVLGGSSFINASHMADSAGFLFIDRCGTDEDYYFLGSLKNSRTDGACCVSSYGDAYYHGGIALDGKIKSELLMLKLTEE